MRASSRTEDIASCLSSSLGKGERERKGSVRGEGGGEKRAEERITGSFRIEM